MYGIKCDVCALICTDGIYTMHLYNARQYAAQIVYNQRVYAYI